MITQNSRERRKKRVRSKIKGAGTLPRLSVFRSNRYLWAQVIDDEKGVTLVAFSSRGLASPSKITKTASAIESGKQMAKKMLGLKITKVVFDRGSYKYEGRVKAFASGVRDGGVTI